MTIQEYLGTGKQTRQTRNTHPFSSAYNFLSFVRTYQTRFSRINSQSREDGLKKIIN